MIELLFSSAKGERHFEDFLCEENFLTIEPTLCQLHLLFIEFSCGLMCTKTIIEIFRFLRLSTK